MEFFDKPPESVVGAYHNSDHPTAVKNTSRSIEFKISNKSEKEILLLNLCANYVSSTGSV